MAGLATQLMRFFSLDFNDGEKLERLKTIGDFAQLHPEWHETLDLGQVVTICGRLEREGYLLSGGNSGYPILGSAYLAANFDERRAAYGEYEFVAEGFARIAHDLGPSVFPVVVEKSNGDPDVGSAFLLGNSHTVMTARHVVENMASVRIFGPQHVPLPIRHITVPAQEEIDVALVLVDGAALEGLQALRCAEPALLDAVLCMGYPPIPGFEALQIVDKSEINSFLRLSSGHIVAESQAYLDRQDYILLNARVKGGNSGGPLVNAQGYVVGMLVHIPLDAVNAEKIDALGYGLAVPTQTIARTLRGDSGTTTPMQSLPVRQLHHGGVCTQSA